MAAVKKAYTRTTSASNDSKENMGKTPNQTVASCRYPTVTPCVKPTVHTLENHGNKALQATPSSTMNRCRSGASDINCNNYPPWFLYKRQQRMIRSSASNSGVVSAPRGLVTYLKLCRPIVPQVRTAPSGYRTYNPYLYEPKMGNTKASTKGDPALMVYGVQFGKSTPCEKNLQQDADRVHIHVFLPCQQQSGRESTMSQSEQDEACSKLTNLSLQGGQKCRNALNKKDL